MTTDIEKKLVSTIRDIPDFPVKGVIFKDITPILLNIELFNEVIDCMAKEFADKNIDKIAAVESRGFIFGMPLALKMKVPFIPVRKKGKLPAKTVSVSYNLEYGQSAVEIHEDAVIKDEKILIVDDLLATGGTIDAAIKLVESTGGKVAAAAFVVELEFLNGRKNIKNKNLEIFSLLKVK